MGKSSKLGFFYNNKRLYLLGNKIRVEVLDNILGPPKLRHSMSL